MIEDNYNVRAAVMEMFSSACHLGKVFHKQTFYLKKKLSLFWGDDVDMQVVNTQKHTKRKTI